MTNKNPPFACLSNPSSYKQKVETTKKTTWPVFGYSFIDNITFSLVQISSQDLKKTLNDNNELPRINREKLTITLKTLLGIFNIFYFTNKYSSCIA